MSLVASHSDLRQFHQHTLHLADTDNFVRTIPNIRHGGFAPTMENPFSQRANRPGVMTRSRREKASPPYLIWKLSGPKDHEGPNFANATNVQPDSATQ